MGKKKKKNYRYRIGGANRLMVGVQDLDGRPDIIYYVFKLNRTDLRPVSVTKQELVTKQDV